MKKLKVGELRAELKRFTQDELIELVVFGLTEEVDHLFEHVPAEDKAGRARMVGAKETPTERTLIGAGYG
ncbi:hypothetical protein L479_01562 [Exiguobacterium sp. S17]|nr:hypothetical protein L479_01562 [Exiguobacterium sp. S17]